jgi:hypothetical protein
MKQGAIMRLQSLPTLKRPQLHSAEEASRFLRSTDVLDTVTELYDRVAAGLGSLDNSEADYNPNPGQVVVVDQFLDGGPDTAVKVQTAELRFDPATGEVQRFMLMKPEGASFGFEYPLLDDGTNSSNPTFIACDDKQRTRFELNPASQAIVSFESTRGT